MRRYHMQTLKEAFADNQRTKTLRLIRSTGEFLARLPIEEAMDRYGNWIYCSAYSESFTELDVWIMRPIEN
jgi:hypothetical protein